MANTLKPKRSSVAGNIPTTTNLTSGEMGVNMADQKIWINNGTSVVQIGSGKVSGLADVVLSSLATGQGLSWNGTNWVNSNAGTGTVTSVSGTGTVSGLTLTGSVTSSGSLTLGGTLSLTSGQVTTALGYTPLSTAGGTLTGTLFFGNASSPNTNFIQFGDNTGWTLRMMTNVSGTPTERFRFVDTGAFNAVGAITQNGNQVLHAGNFSSYAPSLSSTYADPAWITSLASSKLTGTIDNARLNGGTYTINITGNAATVGASTSAGIQSTFVASINTTTPGTGNYGVLLTNSGGAADSAHGITWAWASSGSQAGIYVQSSGAYGTKMYLATTDSFAAGAKTAVSIDHTGAVSVLRSGLTAAAGVVSGGNNGFANATWFSGVRNPIWYFGNSTSYGISYFQGASGIGGADTIGIHPNGTPTSGGSAFSVAPSASYVNSNVVLHAGNYSSYALPLTGGTLSGVLTITSNNDNQLLLQSNDSWTGIGFNDSAVLGAEYIWHNGINGTFAIGGGGANVAGKKLHIHGGATIGAGYATTANPTNGLNVEGAIQQAGNQVLHAGNINSYIPSWSSGVTGSHIVQRDGNGYIYANHINFNTSESENPAISSFITSNGDGWSRKSSLAHVKNSIRGVADGTWSISVTGNAGTATTLQTSRTINGIPFNGSAAIDTTEWFHSDRDFPNGTLITTNINYAVTNGDPFVLEIRGNSYGNIVPLDLLCQGYIYADTIINHGGVSNGFNISGLVAINNGGNLCFWFPSQGYWNGYNVKVYSAYATRATNRVTSITGVAKPTTAKEVALSANIRQSLHSGNYTSYSPSLTGSGASGTWGISVTGSANSLNLSGHTISNSSWAGGGGYHGYQFNGGNWRFGFSSTGGVVDVYADGNFYATDSSHLVLHVGNISSYAISSGGGTISGNNFIDFGPNSSWGATLRVGGNGHGGATRASVATTNGNLHLDGTTSRGVYLNWYNASTEGTFFGNGAGGQVGRVDGGGNATFSGNVSGASDERLKTDWEALPANFIERLAKVKSGTYTRLDSGARQAGASAQDMQKLLKETVMTADDEAGTLSLVYGNAALVSAIELAKDNVDLRARVAKLEALVSKLIEG